VTAACAAHCRWDITPSIPSIPPVHHVLAPPPSVPPPLPPFAPPLKVVREMSRDSSLRTAVLVGGDAMEAQFAELAHNPDVIVATPGESCTRVIVSV
jgi:hypothetical protein